MQTVHIREKIVEDVLALDGGLAWTVDGEVWLYEFDTDTPRQLSKFCDPHALTTNGKELAWLGCETNARYELSTGALRPLPPAGPPPLAKGLAFLQADLFTANHQGLLRRYVDDNPEKLYCHIPGFWTWQYEGLVSGGGFLFAAARETPRSFRLGRVAINPRPKFTELDVRRAKSASGWTASDNGDMLFVDKAADTVWTVSHTSTKSRPAVSQKGLQAACWCDKDVCTLAEGTATRHRGRRSVDVSVPLLDDTSVYSCGVDRLVVSHDQTRISSFRWPAAR